VIILSPHSSYPIKAKKTAAMTYFQFVNANQLRANTVNTLAWCSIAVLSRLYQVLQHTPSNLSRAQLNNFDFYCETVPCNVNLLVDQSYANYFRSCKCSGSITENWRWWKQVKRLHNPAYKFCKYFFWHVRLSKTAFGKRTRIVLTDLKMIMSFQHFNPGV